mmetsp:Transcript_88092/g.227171  ORF Transcript_88092/g.227171 Transcript_88092/m.227171 type:complete len:315 (+) Transcript_88092:159-1103(+)
MTMRRRYSMDFGNQRERARAGDARAGARPSAAGAKTACRATGAGAGPQRSQQPGNTSPRLRAREVQDGSPARGLAAAARVAAAAGSDVPAKGRASVAPASARQTPAPMERLHRHSAMPAPQSPPPVRHAWRFVASPEARSPPARADGTGCSATTSAAPSLEDRPGALGNSTVAARRTDHEVSERGGGSRVTDEADAPKKTLEEAHRNASNAHLEPSCMVLASPGPVGPRLARAQSALRARPTTAPPRAQSADPRGRRPNATSGAAGACAATERETADAGVAAGGAQARTTARRLSAGAGMGEHLAALVALILLL